MPAEEEGWAEQRGALEAELAAAHTPTWLRTCHAASHAAEPVATHAVEAAVAEAQAAEEAAEARAQRKPRSVLPRLG